MPKDGEVEVVSPSQFPALIVEDNCESIHHCSCKFQQVPAEINAKNIVTVTRAGSPLRRACTGPNMAKLFTTTPKPQYITIATPIQTNTCSSDGWSTVDCMNSGGDTVETQSNLPSTDVSETFMRTDASNSYTWALVDSSTITEAKNGSIEKFRRDTAANNEMDFYEMVGPIVVPQNSTFIDEREARCINDYIRTTDLSHIEGQPKLKKIRESESPIKHMTNIPIPPNICRTKMNKPDTQYLTSTPIDKIRGDKDHLTSLDVSAVRSPSYGSNEFHFNASSREVITSEFIGDVSLEEEPEPCVVDKPCSPKFTHEQEVKKMIEEKNPCCVGKLRQTLPLPAAIVCYQTDLPRHPIPPDDLHLF
ncbi:uncharacterized protein LOC141914985 [Tubulanus polymorphus]|uniref:uncharacterized protein LOC141914985 n=1 Tax=Tubulanus polymorphus TaxID=672921 RepID=UPI003DA29918